MNKQDTSVPKLIFALTHCDTALSCEPPSIHYLGCDAPEFAVATRYFPSSGICLADSEFVVGHCRQHVSDKVVGRACLRLQLVQRTEFDKPASPIAHKWCSLGSIEMEK
jgi:hypothetical protein